MKRTVRFLAVVLAALLLTSCAATSENVTINDLLNDMLMAFSAPSAMATARIDSDAEALDDPVLREIAESWKRYYLDPNLEIRYMRRNNPAELQIPDPSKHAFVVLGYCLKDGKMEPELEGRCEAAAAAARAFPGSIIICTGGETGIFNTVHATEAGEMAAYIIDRCGIDGQRLFLDTEARTTAENALNAFRIMKEIGIETMTLVTSGYHLRWAGLLFDAVAAWNREHGYPVEMIGNWCYYISPASGYSSTNEGLAISQLRDLLLYGEDAFFPAPAGETE